jgi:hypothetical protein
MREMEPFQLQTAIPEIGAEPGDWITLDRGAEPPEIVLVRRIPDERVALIRQHVARLAGFCDAVDSGGVVGRMEVVK